MLRFNWTWFSGQIWSTRHLYYPLLKEIRISNPVCATHTPDNSTTCSVWPQRVARPRYKGLKYRKHRTATQTEQDAKNQTLRVSWQHRILLLRNLQALCNISAVQHIRHRGRNKWHFVFRIFYRKSFTRESMSSKWSKLYEFEDTYLKNWLEKSVGMFLWWAYMNVCLSVCVWVCVCVCSSGYRMSRRVSFATWRF